MLKILLITEVRNGQALKTQYERKQMRDKLKKKLEDKKKLLETKRKRTC